MYLMSDDAAASPADFQREDQQRPRSSRHRLAIGVDNLPLSERDSTPGFDDTRRLAMG